MSTGLNPASPTDSMGLNPRRWVGLAVLCASLLIVVMDMTILNVAIPRIDADLKPTSVQLLWIVDAYSLAVAGFLVVASGLCDRFGRRRMLIVGYCVFGAVPLLVLVTNSAVGIIMLRALLGLGGALIMPSTMSMIRDLFTDSRERGVALGIWAAMAAAGAALGPLIGGVLLQAFTWHSAFLVNTPIMVVAIIATVILLPESHGAAVRWDVLSVLLSIVGMIAFVTAIKEFGKSGLSHPVPWATLAVAVVTLTWFGRRCLTSDQPLLDIRLLRRKDLSAGLICALVTSIGMASIMLLLAQWLQLVEKHTPLEAGLRLLPAAVVSGLLSPLAPYIANKIGARAVMVAGLVSSGVGFGLLYFIPRPWSYGILLVCMCLVGIGTASLAIGSAVIMSAAPAQRAGNAAALEETSFEIGGTLGIAVLGSVAAVVYTQLMASLNLAKLGANPEQIDSAHESIGGALLVAKELGQQGNTLASHASNAFGDALSTVGFVGGIIMIIAAVAVWVMTPGSLRLDGH